jgi:hypothetical protein
VKRRAFISLLCGAAVFCDMPAALANVCSSEYSGPIIDIVGST